MLYFFINITPNELILIQKTLTKGSFCLFQLQSGTSRYYGLIRKAVQEEFTAMLTADTREHLEYLDKQVFKHFFLQNMSDTIYSIGNRGLLYHLSDES
jgi:hypothetical protein